MQPNGSRHIHSNEAGLRSSQGVRPQVRVNNVAHVGSKGKCGSLNTDPELLLEAPVRLHAVQSATLASGATSGLTLSSAPGAGDWQQAFWGDQRGLSGSLEGGK